MARKSRRKVAQKSGVDLSRYGPQPGQVIDTARGKARVVARRYAVATLELVEDGGDIAYMFITPESAKQLGAARWML